MSLANLFDLKKKRVVLIVQCRLSSTRLPKKALLPLGSKTVLEWVLASMKKVPADKYYLAVDTDSAEELEPIAKKCGFQFFAGSKDDVLDRFCKVIELSKADVVIRATADNPFLFYEAAEDLLSEYKDRSTSSKIDYITWAGLPHGSGVELFNAHSLLKAAQETDLPYDHEHVGPALYNHKDLYQCLFIRAPRKYYNPDLRTTIDLPSDYRRAQSLVRVISGDKSVDSPYTVQQILAGLQRNEVRFPVLFVPCIKKGCGTGHLRRCLDLAIKLGSDILIPKDTELLESFFLVEQALKNGLHSYQIVQDISQAEQYALAVTDLFETDADFAKLLSEKCPVLALDEGASDTNYADYLLDIIPSVGISRKANKVEPAFIPTGKSRKKKIDFSSPFSTALVVLGGEDPASLTLPATISLAQCSISVVAVISTEEKRAEFEKNIPQELKSFVTVSEPIQDLKDKLFNYDLVVTHYGFTAFEASFAGCATILLGTTLLHTQLARTYNFACIEANDVTQKSFKKLFEQKEKLYRAKDLEEKENLSLADFISCLSRGKRILCPVCQTKSKEKDLVVARTENRTFRRCSLCGMLYMSWTTEEKQTEYNHDYFYDDYKKQYGKTYEDDFEIGRAHV